MEPVKRRKQRFFLGLSLILLLIVTGLGMVYRVFDRYGDIILASEDDQLFRLARSVDRIVVVNDGRIPFTGTPREVFSHSAELRQMGLGIPQVTQVFQRLRELGVPIQDDCVYTMEEAREQLLALYRKGAV